MKIYIAGPITGLSYDQVMGRFKEQSDTLKSYGYDVLCSMVGKDYLKDEKFLHGEGYATPASNSHAIKGRDMWMVRQCDVILIDFSAGDVASIGSCFEMAWANMLGKHIVVVVPEGNIHQHAFVTECADIVFPAIEDAYRYLKDLAEGI